MADAPDPARQAALKAWSKMIDDGRIHKLGETELHSEFMQKICIDALGYKGPASHAEYTVTQEKSILSGSVDLALGHFNDNKRIIVAPLELKGAKTKNLDAIMPSRAKSPVDQAWEYATNNVGTKWVLISNYLEIRLYSYAEGRQFYEHFDLAKLHEDLEYKRFQLLLSEENLLGGRTAELLERSRQEDKDISEELYSDYKKLRHDLINAVGNAAPDMDPLEGISVAQTILDRILFIAFAEDNKLIPDDTISSAYTDQSKFNKQPIWNNFLGLFRAIDKGDDSLNIPRYNGGLFKRDEIIRSLKIPDHICEGFKELATYDFASEVPVTVLGRIFEQSISDIEILQKQALGEEVEEKKGKGTTGRQKRDGIVYTPDYVARFIVEQTIGAHLKEMFDGILVQYAKKGAKVDDDPIAWKSKKAEKQAWSDYREQIAKLRIVDPACGSGVFLVMAFDYLKAELARVNDKLAQLSGTGLAGNLFDPDSEILTNNLFGVDVNDESVEIAKLSLWIKTARRGKVLDSLNDNFKVGDSLIEDSSFAYREHGFVWKENFKQIFDEGGFDIVLGNPPYVRMELIKAMKPYLEKRFEVVSDRADLYSYFFERGLNLLKPGGRLGYISSSTFFKTGSGEPLRKFLLKKASIEAIVDFGDTQIFAGVTTYPVIITMQACPAATKHQLRFWNLSALPDENFEAAFDDQANLYPQSKLANGPWELESPKLRQLREKILRGKPSLKDAFCTPLYGIKTGLNEAFVIDTPTKDKICQDDPMSSDLLKPWLEGKDLRRWRVESRKLWIIYIPKNRVVIDDYPGIRDWLLPFKDRLEKRATKQEWYELQQAQEAYSDAISKPKISYPHFNVEQLFSLENSGAFSNDKTYFLPSTDLFLLALLNSSVSWTILSALAPAVRGGYHEFRVQYVETLPIPHATPDQKAKLATLAEDAQNAAEERYALQKNLTRRIPDLVPDGSEMKWSNKLKSWWELPDFKAFQAEIKKKFKGEIPFKERNDWEDAINDARAQINALSATIKSTEDQINKLVYELFDLTDDEIKLLEANI